MFVREIPSAEADEILEKIAADDSGFESIFNGKDLAGWIGAVNNYEVKDGAIQCKPGRGGNLLTKGTFDNCRKVAGRRTAHQDRGTEVWILREGFIDDALRRRFHAAVARVGHDTDNRVRHALPDKTDLAAHGVGRRCSWKRWLALWWPV